MTQRDLLPAPKTADEAMAIASRIAKSGLIPKQYQGKPEDVFACMLWCHTLGMPIMQGLQSITVINGRPSLFGDGLLAVVMSSGKLEDFKETIETDSNGVEVATCTVKRKGLASPVTWSFSKEDARKAGLLSKTGPWQQYPKRMLQMRARAFALRSAFPDVLSGMACAEEMEDVEDSTRSDVPEAAPARKMPARKTAKKVELADVSDLDPIEPPEPPAPEPVAELEAPAEEVPAFDADGLRAQIEATEEVNELRRLYCHAPKEIRDNADVLEAFRARKEVLEGAA